MMKIVNDSIEKYENKTGKKLEIKMKLIDIIDIAILCNSYGMEVTEKLFNLIRKYNENEPYKNDMIDIENIDGITLIQIRELLDEITKDFNISTDIIREIIPILNKIDKHMQESPFIPFQIYKHGVE